MSFSQIKLHFVNINFQTFYELFNIYLNLQKSNLILKSMEDIVLKVMDKAGKPLKSGEIAGLAGIDKKDVDKAIKKLKVKEKINSPKRCFYEIKK